MRRQLLTASLLPLCLVSACSVQPAGSPYSAKFQLAPLVTPAGVAVQPTEHKPKGTETLVVNISQFLSKFRRVLAVPAVVNKVIITVTASDGTVFTEILDLAKLTAGHTSVTFNGLVPGEATIVIEAYDATDKVIGSSRDTARITPGVIAQKEIALPIGNTSSSSFGGSGGGGAAPAATPTVAPSPGALATNVSLIGGPSLISLAPWLVSNEVGIGVAFGPTVDRYWAIARTDFDSYAEYKLTEVSPTGIITKSYVLDQAFHRLTIDRSEHFWLADNAGQVYRLSPTGSPVWIRDFLDASAPYTLMTADMVVDADNHVWLPYQNRLLRVSPAGDVVTTIPLDQSIDIFIRDPHSGVMWGAPLRGNWVLKVDPTGTATRYPVASKGSSNGVLMGIDATGHVWLPRRDAQEVIKLAPDGTVAARFAVPGIQGAYCNKSGTPWILGELGTYRLGPDGRPGDGYAIRNVSYAATCARTGTVWLRQGSSLFPLPL